VIDTKLATATLDEIDYMAPRGEWDDFQQHWTPIQRAIYLGQLRDHYGKTFSERACILGVDQAELRREIEGLWGVLLWDRSATDPVPSQRD
jgi:hypothetical protein